MPSNRSLWGNGSIEVEGTGTVEDAFVFYNYRVDPCYDPQSNPLCPGYQAPEPPEVETVDVDSLYSNTLDEELLSSSTDTDLNELYDDEENSEDHRESQHDTRNGVCRI